MQPDRAVLVAAVLVVGTILCWWIFAPVFRGPAAARRDLGTLRLALASVGVVLFLNLLLTLPLAAALQAASPLPRLLIGAASTEVPMLAVLFFRVVAPGAATWPQLGLRAISPFAAVRRGLFTGLGGIVLVALVGLALARFNIQSNQAQEFLFLRGANRAAVAAVFLVAAVLAPFVEELFFRGFVFGCLRRRWPTWFAALVSSAVFAVLHVQPGSMDPAQAIGVFTGILTLGLLLAWTYQRSGSLVPGMIAHGVNNAISLSLLLLLPATV